MNLHAYLVNYWDINSSVIAYLSKKLRHQLILGISTPLNDFFVPFKAIKSHFNGCRLRKKDFDYLVDNWGMNRSVVAHLLKICNFNLSKVN